MLVTRSTSFTGLGRFPSLHIQIKFAKNTAETRSASCQQSLLPASEKCRRNEWAARGIICFQRVCHPLRRKKHSSCEPYSTQGKIEPTRYLGKRSDFRIVNAAEPVRLHHAMPDAPDKSNQHDSFEVPNGKCCANDD